MLNPSPGPEMSGFENFKPGSGFYVHAVWVLPVPDWPGLVRAGFFDTPRCLVSFYLFHPEIG